MSTQFSTYIKDLRIAKRLTLRDFCVQVGLDPSNWSKVERGVNPPPSDSGILDRIASFLGCDTAQRQELFDIAALSRGQLPPDLTKNQIFMTALPAFFRSARGHKLTQEDIEAFAKDVEKLHQPD